MQYNESNNLPTRRKVLAKKRGNRGGANVQRKRSESNRDISTDDIPTTSNYERACNLNATGRDLLYWIQQRAYGRNRTANLRVGLYNQALSYLRDNNPDLSTEDHTKLLDPILDLAMVETAGERYFADAMNVPGAAASMIRASLAATKGELESTRPAGLARAAGAMVLSTCGTMLSGVLGYVASQTVSGIIPKLAVGLSVAGVGAVASNLTAAHLLKPVKVKTTLPGM